MQIFMQINLHANYGLCLVVALVWRYLVDQKQYCAVLLYRSNVHVPAFFRVSDTFKLTTFIKQLVAIGFPDVDALDKFSVEINYSEDHFDSAMNDIAERVESNRKEYPMLVDVVTHDEVAQEYEKLRKIRNRNFPDIRAWPHWGGSDEGNPTERSNKGMPKSKRTRRSKSKRRYIGVLSTDQELST
jgi:hypothetical protein